MQKETIVAIVRAEIRLSEKMHQFLAQYSNQEGAWFARDSGEIVLAEFGYEWNNNFVEVTQSVIDAHFRYLGLSEEWLPKVKLTDSRRGSWIMEAALTMFGTIGTAYTILKGKRPAVPPCRSRAIVRAQTRSACRMPVVGKQLVDAAV